MNKKAIYFLFSAVSRNQVLPVPKLARPLDEDEEAVRPPDADVSLGARLQLLAHLPRQEGHHQSPHLGARWQWIHGKLFSTFPGRTL